ncbi:MAG: hypothetical protein GY938_16980 [Ketobacter sp.]|nr:hypothetical protein [Ketobacter sp.]
MKIDRWVEYVKKGRKPGAGGLSWLIAQCDDGGITDGVLPLMTVSDELDRLQSEIDRLQSTVDNLELRLNSLRDLAKENPFLKRFFQIKGWAVQDAPRDGV